MKASETNVLSFIGGLDKVFIIPPFQRNYEWSKKQCEELFYDIENAYYKKKTHYLGNVVYYFGENNGAEFQELILVDGQQRISTIVLLLCAIRDCEKDSDFKDKVTSRYLKNDTKNDKFRIRLKQTSYDYQSFISVVEKKTVPNDENNIVKNYNTFLDLLNKTEIPLNEIYNTIQKLEIVGVNLQIENDLETIQTIFEKINSTGKPLSPADLIRNYLLISKSSEEQQILYDNYWVNIENIVGNDDVSILAKNYLIMKTYDDVVNSEIYSDFKYYFSNTSISHEEILKELEIFAKYFSWINKFNSPNKELNKYFQELNALKTDDIYPLYLYLINALYDSNEKELVKIFKLLTDFLLRYRIVAPAGGGGVLRSVIQNLIRKMDSDEIEINYESIYFELSNSSTKTGRFPTDEDFYLALTQSRKTNHTYGKVLLRKIEEFETKNIGVPLEEITVEHFMPQTLTPWWKENYGGDLKSYEIYEKYLNCIGNLGIMSQGYNSSNSNKPWNEKLEFIKLVQFNVTKEVSCNLEWKEEQIKKRNEDLAKRACNAITAPLKRTVPLMATEFENGLYPASDITTNMNGSDVKYVIYDNNILDIKSWRYYFNELCRITYELNSEKIKQIVQDNIIHKASNKYDKKQKDPIITINKNFLVEPKKIGDTEFYSEGSLSSERARIYAKQLLDIYKITDKIQICVENRDE